MCFSRRKIRRSSQDHFSSSLTMPPISFSPSLDAISFFSLNLSLFLSSSRSVLSPAAMCILHCMIKRKQQSKIDLDITENHKDNTFARGGNNKALLGDLIQCVTLCKRSLSIKGGGSGRASGGPTSTQQIHLVIVSVS